MTTPLVLPNLTEGSWGKPFSYQMFSGMGGCLMRKKRVICFFVMLCLVCVMPAMVPGQGYAQEAKRILSIVAYDMLNTLPDTYLIDVRTRAEYQFVGHPLNAYLFPYRFFSPNLAKENDAYAYQLGPVNAAFIEEISKAFKKTDNLLVMGRDGTRSGLAAKALIEAGFKNVYDVEDGFEGAEFPDFEDKDLHKYYRQIAKTNNISGFKHRRHYGWQWWGIPWTYEIDPKYVYPPDVEGLSK